MSEQTNHDKKTANTAGLNRNGRPKGALNKINSDIKAMIHGALEDLGGQEWMKLKAEENPVAFFSLVSKLIPSQVNAEVTGHITMTHEQWLESLK